MAGFCGASPRVWLSGAEYLLTAFAGVLARTPGYAQPPHFDHVHTADGQVRIQLGREPVEPFAGAQQVIEVGGQVREVGDVGAEVVFLQHLETSRGNGIATRNARLTAGPPHRMAGKSSCASLCFFAQRTKFPASVRWLACVLARGRVR